MSRRLYLYCRFWKSPFVYDTLLGKQRHKQILLGEYDLSSGVGYSCKCRDISGKKGFMCCHDGRRLHAHAWDEIQTAARYKRDILYIVFNNSYYGATYFNNKRNIKEMSALPTHNWKKFSESLGLTGWRVNTLDELRSALKNKSEQSGTFLIDMICDHEPETPVSEYKARVVEAGVL